MKLQLYTVFDEKAAAYLQPFWAANDAVAIRTFTSAIQEPGHGFFTHAEDYSLWAVGSFEQDDGTLETAGLQHLAYAHHIKAALLNRENIEMRNNGAGLEATTDAR